MISEYMNERIIITGSNGLVGSVLKNALSEYYTIIGIDKVGESDDTSTVIGDISDFESLRQIFTDNHPVSTILHLAANPHPHTSADVIFKDNFITTRNIYECAKEFNVKRVIFAGSTHMFGGYEGYPLSSPLGRPITNADLASSDSDYGDSKTYGEILGQRYFNQFGTESISIRIGHVTKDDKPEAPYEPLWLSYRDLVQVFHKAIETKITHGAYFAMSDNKNLMFDISSTIKDLGYKPQDNA